MISLRCCTVAVMFLSFCVCAQKVWSLDLAGYAQLELSAYAQEGQFAHQDYQHNLSVAVEPELYWEWGEGVQSITLKPFFRLDEHDGERTRGDIREFSWLYANGLWEWIVLASRCF